MASPMVSLKPNLLLITTGGLLLFGFRLTLGGGHSVVRADKARLAPPLPFK